MQKNGWKERRYRMSELIDRQALIKQLKDENIPFNADINEIINIQPIAFDIDNIVEKLEEEKCKNVTYKDRYAQGWNNGTANAIYIVKQEINNGLE